MYFYKFLNMLNSDSALNAQFRPEDVDFIKDRLVQCHHLYFHPRQNKFQWDKDKDCFDNLVEAIQIMQKKQPEDVDELDNVDEIDLPFDVCWLEIVGDNYITIASEQEQYKINIAGLFVVEESPRTYIIYALSEFKNPYPGIDSIFLLANVSKEKETYEAVKKILDLLLKRLSRESAYIVEKKQEIRYKHRGQKLKHKLNPFIYVHHDSNKSTHATSKKDIVYTTKWEVRGHWRKLENTESIGKNRHGQRTEKGWTWVIPYIKGSEQANLVDKIRITK